MTQIDYEEYIGVCDNCRRKIQKDEDHFMIAWRGKDYILCNDCVIYIHNKCKEGD